MRTRGGRPRFRSLAALSFLLCIAAPSQAQVLRQYCNDEVYPANAVDYERGLQTMVVAQIVDDFSGEPIPGAVMRIVPETDFPLPGMNPVIAEAKADAFGWARISLDGLPGGWDWCQFDAPGYAPRGSFGSHPDNPIRLVAGGEGKVRFLDHLGRPVVGLELGLIAGCGHTPAVRQATTDVLGIATFSDVHPMMRAEDVWPRHPRVESEYLVTRELFPGPGMATIEVASARGVRGRVVDQEGTPVKGLYVGAPACKRGPWVLTDAEGTFSLPGIPRDIRELYLLSDARIGFEQMRSGRHWFTIPPPGVELTLRVDENGSIITGERSRSVRLEFAGGKAKASGVSITAYRVGDGLGFRPRRDEQGELEVKLNSEDSWRIRLEDSRHRWQTLDRPISADEIRAGRLTLDLVENRKMMVTVATPTDLSYRDLFLLTEDAKLPIRDEFSYREELSTAEFDVYDAEIPVPADQRVVLSTSAKRIEITPKTDRVDIVEEYRRLRIGSIADPQGKEVAATLKIVAKPNRFLRETGDEPHLEFDPEEELLFRKQGDAFPRWLLVWPREQRTLEPHWLRLPEPEKGSRSVKIDQIRLAARPQRSVQVSLPDGRPAAGAHLVSPKLEWGIELDEKGAWHPRALRTEGLRGLTLRVDPPWTNTRSGVGMMPAFLKLEGEPPWKFAWPTGELVLTPSPTENGLPSADVYVDGREFGISEGLPRLRITGLTPGRHRCVVVRSGHPNQVIEFMIAGEAVTAALVWD